MDEGGEPTDCTQLVGWWLVAGERRVWGGRFALGVRDETVKGRAQLGSDGWPNIWGLDGNERQAPGKKCSMPTQKGTRAGEGDKDQKDEMSPRPKVFH